MKHGNPLEATRGRRGRSRHPRADERTGTRNRLAPGCKLLMKQGPRMDHAGPYLQCYLHVSGPSDIAETNCVVEECLRRAHLNQKWGQALEICIQWRGQRRAGISAMEIGSSQLLQV